MIFGYVFATLYLCIAAVFAILTYLEGSRNRSETKPYRFFGLLLCLIWPALVIAMLISQKVQHSPSQEVSHSRG